MTNTTNSHAGRRVNHALLGAGALVALLAVGLLRGGAQKRPRPPSEARSEAASSVIAVTKAPPKPAPQAAPEKPAPVIDAITVEKSEVCRGEENLISVKAHTLDGTDSNLRFLIAGRAGDRVPVRAAEAKPMLDGKPAPPRKILVLGANGTVTVADVPHYEVKECREAHSLFVTPHLLANTWGRYGFEARLVDVAGEPMKPVSYHWTFGDGEEVTTTAPRVEHDYESRRQDRVDSLYLVSVEARDQKGQVVRGRASLALHNAARESFEKKGLVELLVALEPRFPELGGDGVVRQSVRLRHIHGESARISRVIATEVHEDGREVAREVSPESLGVSEIPAGEGLTLSLELDTNRQPGVNMIRYELGGTTREGDPVLGSFAVMRPTAAPTRASSTPVSDPKLIARIKLARAILKRPVSDGDLEALAREGAFAALEAAERGGSVN